MRMTSITELSAKKQGEEVAREEGDRGEGGRMELGGWAFEAARRS